ncbi:MAG: bifunctional UDP-N-acetylmuramoyl-tripeptide:D-alanyl-D-alanine ligase/alanine racemase, partial [Bacteroidales bacterium]|nr:bifunctional UDP-N-acetylmuramoyl-tripeptide:D-alanyl-D-alanine ligase/alanine racemase [Bacteroidales bacterium]
MHFNYSVSQLSQITGAEVYGHSEMDDFVDDILIDSRKFIAGSRSIFIAIKTSANDGHLFINDLIAKGVRCFLVSKIPDNVDVGVYLLVKDTLKALQKISVFHRKQFNIPVIGITGSNGKTIVKEWLYQVLSDTFQIVRSPKSYNSQIGVPLSVLQLNPEANLAIFEAGISMPDEMDYLQQIILPEIGIFTNIGHAHDENFIDKRQKINEKIQLFKKCKQIIFCRDHGEISERIMSLDAFRDKKLTSWSLRNKAADLYI